MHGQQNIKKNKCNIYTYMYYVCIYIYISKYIYIYIYRQYPANKHANECKIEKE